MRQLVRELNPVEVYIVGMSLFGTIVLALSREWLSAGVGGVLTVLSVIYVVLVRRYLDKRPRG